MRASCIGVIAPSSPFVKLSYTLDTSIDGMIDACRVLTEKIH